MSQFADHTDDDMYDLATDTGMVDEMAAALIAVMREHPELGIRQWMVLAGRHIVDTYTEVGQ